MLQSPYHPKGPFGASILNSHKAKIFMRSIGFVSHDYKRTHEHKVSKAVKTKGTQ